MSSLSTVTKFEILKRIRKKSFWISILIFPAFMLIFGGISYLNIKLSESQQEADRQNITSETSKGDYLIGVIDESNIINPKLLTKLKLKSFKAQTNNEAFFKQKPELDALIVYQPDLIKNGIDKYIHAQAKDEQTQKLQAGVDQLAFYLASESVDDKIEPATKAIVKKEIDTTTKVFNQDGQDYDPIKKMIVPTVFLVIFFLIFTMSGNQMLVSVTEEKESRIAEMILTSINGQTLIVAKIISLIVTSVIQVVSIIVPLIIFYFVANKMANLPPEINQLLTNPIIEFWPIFFGVMFLIFGFLMLTSLIILIGSLFPTAQEAGQFFGFIFMAVFLPFYFIGAIASGSDNIIIQFISYFPTTSTLTMLIRNATGNLPILDGFIGLIVTILFSIISIKLAVRAFKSGLFEYSKKLSLKSLIKSQK